MPIQDNFEFHILVNNKPIEEYVHKGNSFVEGRKGSNFEIQFFNKSYKNILAIPSVDGLDTIEGKEAGINSRGYIVNPFSSIKIPGWTLDPKNVAKFVFANKQSSYAVDASPTGAKNSGVIGFLVFDEVPKVYPIPYSSTSITAATPHLPMWQNILQNTPNNIRGPEYNSVFTANIASSVAGGSLPTSTQNTLNSSEVFNLGTGFGNKSEYQTTQIEFQRGSQLAQIVLYYDSYKNLIKRGIKIENKVKIPDLPSAFPNLGCKPPAGWKG